MLETQLAPTLEPTSLEFSDPIAYLSSIDIVKLGEKYGILKIKPPQGWRPKFAIDMDTFTFHTRYQNLWELDMVDRSRTFFFDGFNNFLRSKGLKPLRSSKNKKRGRKRKHPTTETPDFDGFITLKNGQKVHIYDMFRSKQVSYYAKQFTDCKLAIQLEKYCDFLQRQNHTNHSNKSFKSMLHHSPRELLHDNTKGCVICNRNTDLSHMLICDGCEREFHMGCLSPPMKKLPQNEWYCTECMKGTDGEYGFEEDFDNIFSLSEFKEDCDTLQDEYYHHHFLDESPNLDTLEHEFWSLIHGISGGKRDEMTVRYGADIHQTDVDKVSGFPTSANPNVDQQAESSYVNHPFNLTQLPFAKGSLLNYIRCEDRNQISGMTVPWLYIGSLFSTFCWHKEDHYTMSANYCHKGATKKWYAIPASDCSQFEKLCKDMCPDYFAKQPDLLHQMVSLISPHEIKLEEEKQGLFKDQVHIYTVNQQENEFVITFPMVYHAGFNCGFNINEAVNFTMPYWLGYGDLAIHEYKKFGKENVFNHYKLLKNIMDVTLKDKNRFDKTVHIFGYESTVAMLKCAVSDYNRQINIYKQILMDENLREFLNRIPHENYQQYLLKKKELQKTVRKPLLQRMTAKKALEEELDNPDEYICCDCKSFVNFEWIEVDLLKSIIEDSKARQLPTPRMSPKAEDDAGDVESEWASIIERAKHGDDHRHLRKKRKLKEKNIDEDINIESKKNERLIARLKKKRLQHLTFGKAILCLGCLRDELQKLSKEDRSKLIRCSTLYIEYEPDELAKNYRRKIVSKLEALGI